MPQNVKQSILVMVAHKYEDHNSVSLLVTTLRPCCTTQAEIILSGVIQLGLNS